MTTTLTTMPSSSEGKRNKKTKALNGLLSATALGLFLEGCKSSTSTSSSTRECIYNGETVTCDEYDRLTSDLTSDFSSGSSSSSSSGTTIGDSTISSGGSCTINGRPCSDVFSSVVVASALGQNGKSVDNLLKGSSDTNTLVSEGSDSAGYADFDEDDENDLSESNDDDDVATDDSQDNDNVDVVVAEIDDTIEGTNGNDVLQGGTGADTYVFSEGDGKDTVVEVVEEGAVNTLRFEGDYEASDFSFERSSEDGKDLVIIADTDGDGSAENEVTLENYFASETGTEIAYSIVVQINDGETFTPSLEG